MQHAGVSIGRLHEPLFVPAAIVEAVCGLCLLWGAMALFRSLGTGWRAALIPNGVALAGVLLGIAALVAAAGPRTPSNDLYHRLMLALIAASFFILFFARSGMRGS